MSGAFHAPSTHDQPSVSRRSFRYPRAAVCLGQAGDVDLSADRDPALRRAVLRLRRLPGQSSGDLRLRPPVPRQEPGRINTVRADPQQPDDGLGGALRTARPAARTGVVPGADAASAPAASWASSTSSTRRNGSTGCSGPATTNPRPRPSRPSKPHTARTRPCAGQLERPAAKRRRLLQRLFPHDRACTRSTCWPAWGPSRGSWSVRCKGHFSSRYFGPVDFVGLYWHLVDMIWIYLFPLLYLIH